MGIKLNSSAKLNKEFSNQVAFLSEDCGIDLHVARNIMRFRRNLKNVRIQSVWTDPKTGLPLTQEQWTGPVLRRANKVKNGTNTKRNLTNSPYLDDHFSVNQSPEATWSDATYSGMIQQPTCLWDGNDEVMDATQIRLEMKNPAMRNDNDDDT